MICAVVRAQHRDRDLVEVKGFGCTSYPTRQQKQHSPRRSLSGDAFGREFDSPLIHNVRRSEQIIYNQKKHMDSSDEKAVNVIDPGHSYELKNFEAEGSQTLNFIKKEKDEETGEFKTVQDGTTNEAVIAALIDRLGVLNGKMHSEHNDLALNHLTQALDALNKRTAEREARGVEGTPQA